MTDLKSVNELKILKNNFLVGKIIRTQEGCRLELENDFLSQKKNLTFQISAKQKIYEYKGAGLPAYFAGLLPEGLRLKALVKKIKTSEDDMFSLLIASGFDPVGDIHFAQNQFSEIDLKTGEEIPQNFKLLRENLKHGIDLSKQALAGVQDKLSADRISLPISVKKKNKSYILKLSSKEYPDLIENEKCTLDLAKICGLAVNHTEIVKDQNDEEALLVERFDRDWDKAEKKWIRYHQEDACQFLNRYPADKYRLSIQEIADGLIKFSTTPEIEILNLLKQIAFSYLVGNSDLHAKNISLIQKNNYEVCQLSPCYDLVCTALYGDDKMALMFDGKNQNIKKKNFIEFGLRYQVPEAAIDSMLQKLVQKFQENNEMIFSIPLAVKKKKYLQQLFKERLAHLK